MYLYKKTFMKNISFVFILIPTLMFGQVSSWRSNSTQQSQSTPRVQPSVNQRNQGVSSWRNNLPQQNTKGVDRIRNWGRINQFDYYWGNFGWYQPFPYIWYDEFGWRQRSVINVYENGKRDTIRKEPIFTSFGLGHTNNNQSSFWGMSGRKRGYFILDYTMSYDIDQNKYFENGRINEVDFTLSNNDFIRQGTLYIGGGKRIGKFGIHTMIGFGKEVIRYRGKDDLGGISFPKSNTNFTTLKIGIIKEFKIFTLKLDSDPIRGFTQIGIGLNN